MRNYVAVGCVGLAVLSLGCESGDTAKSWAEFSRCMAGDGLSDSALVAERLRNIELNERQPAELWDAKTQWPGRCEGYASALYGSLGSSTEHKLLKRSLKGQLECTDGDVAQCSFSKKGDILPAAQKLWSLAANAGLKQDASVQVPVPRHEIQLEDAKKWKPLASKDYSLADKFITPSGTLRLLLRSAKGPLTICDAAGSSASCSAVSADGPKLAAQSVKLLRDEEAIVTGLTEDGRKGFLAKSGEKVSFRGVVGNAAREGLVIEKSDDGQGFLAVMMSKGKTKGKASFAPKVAAKVSPVTTDAFASWVEGADWHVGTVKGNRFKDVATFSGKFSGDLKPCRTAGPSFALWGGRAGQHKAKPTSGNKTTVYASFSKDGKWTEPVTGDMPFERSITGSRCGDGQLDVFWASANKGKMEVGQVACTAAGCDAKSTQWPGFDVKLWLAAGAAGDQFVALWTTALGETRYRFGDPANFSKAPEKVLFESHDRGGPLFRRAETFFTKKAAYLLVHDNGPTLLHLDAKGVHSIGGK